ncbi:MAG: hypothetical protein FWC72_02550 [Oscillospiraceae bacterium]|nr:hypothetical protein [Oscillospiraceae bacterium]
MKRRIFVLSLVLLLLSACTGPGYEIGSVRIIADGIEYTPFIHGISSSIVTNGQQVIASGGGLFSERLAEALWSIPIISYTNDLQILVEGKDGTIGTFWSAPAYIADMGSKQIPLRAVSSESFTDGRADVSLPGPGEFLVFVDVQWGSGREFTTNRYIFRIER